MEIALTCKIGAIGSRRLGGTMVTVFLLLLCVVVCARGSWGPVTSYVGLYQETLVGKIDRRNPFCVNPGYWPEKSLTARIFFLNTLVWVFPVHGAKNPFPCQIIGAALSCHCFTQRTKPPIIGKANVLHMTDSPKKRSPQLKPPHRTLFLERDQPATWYLCYKHTILAILVTQACGKNCLIGNLLEPGMTDRPTTHQNYPGRPV